MLVVNSMARYFGLIARKTDLFTPIISLILVGITGYLGGHLGFVYAYIFAIVSYNAVSAFVIIRGISFFIGGFVNESALIVGLFTEKDIPEMTLV